MLCTSCAAIFQQVYVLGSAEKLEWGQDLASFHKARVAGCQICNFLWTQLPNRSQEEILTADDFPIHYAFKLHNAEWARFGQEPEYLEIQIASEETEKFAEERAGTARSRFGADYNVHKLRYTLKNDCEKLMRGDMEMWAVLTFEVGESIVNFPLQVYKGDKAEELSQVKLADQDTTGSAETLQLGLHWLSECISNHSECKPVYKDQSWHPHRLINIGTADEPCLRLTLGSQLPPDTRYATLSYCWGDMEHSIVTKETLESFFQNIPVEALSSTARDGVHVARALGLQYLWIDSLCIVQNDEQEFYTQCAQMAKVYGLSTCTIAAAASKNGNEPFLCRRNQYSVRPCEVPNPFSKKSEMSFQISVQSLGPMFDEEVKNAAWHNRGWVFQERLLSQRLLIFGPTQMMWSCQRLSAAESWPSGRTSKHHIDRFESFEAEKLELHRLLNPNRRLGVKDVEWESVVQRYTKADVRKSSDRMIALQGIASRVADATERKYAFGLWLDDTLPESLLWRLSTSMIGSHPRLLNTPSWSWGSVSGPIVFVEDQARLDQIHVRDLKPQTITNKQGKTTVHLALRGPVVEMTLSPHTSKLYFQMRRETGKELQRRLSIHPGPTLPFQFGDEEQGEMDSSARTRMKARAASALHVVKRMYTTVLDVLRPLFQVALIVCQHYIYNPIAAIYNSTLPLWQWIYSKAISPALSLLASIGWLVLAALAFPIMTMGEGIDWVWRNKYCRPVLRSVWLYILRPLFYTLAFIVFGLWLAFTYIIDMLWSPIRWVGYQIHGDPAWDWILLWNITAPFPYYFPWIFGPLRTRPRTAKEWGEFRMQEFSRWHAIPEGPTYSEWIARAIPHDDTPFLDAECWLDEAPESDKNMDVTCLLVIRRFYVHGLLLQRVSSKGNQYRRVGIFRSSKWELAFAFTEETVRPVVLV